MNFYNQNPYDDYRQQVGTPGTAPGFTGTQQFGGGFPGTQFGGFPGNQFGGFPGGFGGFPGGQFGGFPFPGFPGTQQPGDFPPSAPPFGGGDAGAPTTPPPSFTPQLTQQDVSTFAVDPGGIRGCLYRFTYIWLTNGRSFWFYPTFVGRNSIAGYRWRRFRWEYYGTDLRRISSFRCGGF
ncbi:hypothetical protein ACFYKX_15260 [Cytobacillus sp. FJAT-54145]|uniref:Transporter n=1 Tax=Cytobacillus spartinae TaxID=3299023 RepID=A0ABW6KCR2_9BACI